jgi:hypothetical protein
MPRKIFLQKAREDLVVFETELRRRYHFFRSSRESVVSLLREAIRVAEQKNYDDALYTTYKNIQTLITGWYCEDVFKNTIRETLHQIDGAVINRTEAKYSVLLRENQGLQAANKRLKRGFDALDKAHKLSEELQQKTMDLLRAANEELAKKAQQIERLQAELEEAKRVDNNQANEALERYQGPGVFWGNVGPLHNN